jgi:acetyltransferase-like isoleucine patch superfamily enzyme
VRSTAFRIATAWPFRKFHRAIDWMELKWNVWRTYNRARSLFPGADSLSIALSTQFKYRENITIGRHVLIGPDTVIGARSPVKLADHVRVSQGVLIETASLDLSQPVPYPHISRPITAHGSALVP